MRLKAQKALIPDKKAQIQENFKLLRVDKMEENKQKIADLEANWTNQTAAAALKSIANLKRQQAESEKTITDLKDQFGEEEYRD